MIKIEVYEYLVLLNPNGHACYEPGEAGWGKSGVASLSKIACGKGGLKRQSCAEVCTHKKGG